MATPPKLPPDAFKQPGTEPESPFDVISSAPKPAPARKQQQLALPTWAGRYPIAAHDHATQLDMDAAVNEFGLRMPREQAEDEAYRQYLYHPQRGQHAQAALHHLRGMKAAHAAGDMDTARNHSLMFNLHSKALGKQPHEMARDLQSQMQNLPSMSKFKAHRGDAFAVTQPPPQEGTGVISSSPPPQLNKREQEVLHMLYLMGQAALAKSRKKTAEIEPAKYERKHRCKQCGHLGPLEYGNEDPRKYHYQSCPQYMAHSPEVEKSEPGNEVNEAPLQKAGPIRSVPMAPMVKGDVVGTIGNPAGAAPQPNQPQTELNIAPHNGLSTNYLLHHVSGRALDNYDDQNAVMNHLVDHHGLGSLVAQRLVQRHSALSLDDPTDRKVFADAVDKAKNCKVCGGSGFYTDSDGLDDNCPGCLGRPVRKGEVVGEIHGAAPKQPKHKAKGFNDITIARGRKKLGVDGGKDPAKYGEYFEGRTKKAEMSSSKHCKCDAYKFPHRHGGGKCKESK